MKFRKHKQPKIDKKKLTENYKLIREMKPKELPEKDEDLMFPAC